MCDIATADPRPGGHLYMCWPGEYYTSGEYIQLEENKAISFSWLGKGEPHLTRVDIGLTKHKGGTLVKLAHREIGKGQKWADIASVYETEWKSGLENLASVLENGADLRITRRPMLGIYLGEFDSIIGAKLGIPVEYGTRLNGVIDGMGAQKAGLQKDDVIVAIDEHELNTGTSLTSLLGKKHAGDVVEVTFYRGPEKKITKMTLSGRPIPPIPSSIPELAEQIGKMYHEFEAELDPIFNSASEAECSYKPGALEWSAKEVIAHLIQDTVYWQNTASDIIQGNEAAYDGYGDNLQARIIGMMTAFPTKAELLKELKAHITETISMFAHLPDELLTHKGRFWKLVYQAHQSTYHQQTHLEQIKAAIQAYKKQ